MIISNISFYRLFCLRSIISFIKIFANTTYVWMFWNRLIMNFFIMSNFNWFDSSTHNFFLKNKIFSINLNFLSNISSYDFLFSCKTFLILIHVQSSWLIVLTRSNRINFEFFFVSFNFCTIRESTFFADKIV